ncbi:MAG TPA: GNAT family N-acetyltransferase, partial [Flavobacterium sp.]
MKNYTIRQYSSDDRENWNAFISKAKNATFLFNRDFMEYHSDRFEDCSVLILDNDKWIAVLPANKTETTLHSHQGLTYGGLVYGEKMKLATAIEIFRQVLKFLSESGIELLNLKLIPSIYHDKPSDEILYALFPAEAKLTRRDSLSVLDQRAGF